MHRSWACLADHHLPNNTSGSPKQVFNTLECEGADIADLPALLNSLRFSNNLHPLCSILLPAAHRYPTAWVGKAHFRLGSHSTKAVGLDPNQFLLDSVPL